MDPFPHPCFFSHTTLPVPKAPQPHVLQGAGELVTWIPMVQDPLGKKMLRIQCVSGHHIRGFWGRQGYGAGTYEQ